ncbi:cyclin-dependent kinases regulatory subunit [Tieghemostelium lacteum]|uniref:Cyclin-dependent kinases regulatory subunit n=1 Tax=Tieghemostelium lacteum TaxID=361077 RepID=A0A151ZBL9_TIELA|nr:cyclin-dependent kinases regulatory subunit [Tieghemostelium lacteum]|eukprot:KYQ91340.1 cyclin-dependent kinases regulatory subunit [Tieghemostelium lacteum]
MPNQPYYSNKYYDKDFEYRHVILPIEIYNSIPKGQLLTEEECRKIGVKQSDGWVHYAFHKPEPHILLFRRPHTGEIPNDVDYL